MADQAQASAGGKVSEGVRTQVRTRRSLVLELAITTVVILVITHVLYMTRAHSFIGPKLSYIVAYLLMGAPILVLWLRKRPLDFFSIGGRDLLQSLKWFAIVSLVVFPPFLIAAHGWQIVVGGHDKFVPADFPRFFNIMLVQLILVALPEEFYFRGYFQSTMHRILPATRRFLGIRIGWGFFITAAAFAVAHTIVTYKWWHFSIFFPALAFGWLRERTGNVIAPTLFHATANLLMDWFVRSYV